MKRIILTIAMGMCATVLVAQDLQSIKKNIYYRRYPTAVTQLHQYLDKNPNNAEAWYLLTKTYLLNDRLDAAEDTIKNVPPGITNEPFVHVATGAILLQRGQTEADKHFRQALDDTKRKNVAIHEAIAFAHIHARQGNGQYALDVLNSLRKKDKKNARWFLLTGDAYRKLLDGSEAYKRYQRALHVDEKYAKAYYRLGQIFQTQKNNDVFVQYFQKAVAADPGYDPALYQLYLYEFNRNPAKAMAHYKNFLKHRKVTIDNEYDMVDLLYLNKNYEAALAKAAMIGDSEKDSLQPRIHKLIAYSYAGLKDTAKAVEHMNDYFSAASDTNLIVEDFKYMSSFLTALDKDSLAYKYLEDAVNYVPASDTAARLQLYSSLASLAEEQEQYSKQAKWLERYYTENRAATNVDLFNWGLSHYKSDEFAEAAEVFRKYVEKYPEQSFGYYWVARSAALQDDELQGLAVPAYEKLIEVLQKDTATSNYKSWITQAYGYLAAYEANTEKNYSRAIELFEKLLEIDPDNTQASDYIEILRKNEQLRAQK